MRTGQEYQNWIYLGFEGSVRICCCGAPAREIITTQADLQCREKAAEKQIEVTNFGYADRFVLIYSSTSSDSCSEKCIHLSRKLGFLYDQRGTCCCGDKETEDERDDRVYREDAKKRRMDQKLIDGVARFTKYEAR